MTRIVHCPGCKALLVEPTTGVAIYQCGNCSMVLVAKHARSSLENAAPLYKQRERQPVALPSPGPSPRPPLDASVPPLYTPRNGNAAANGRLSSAAAPPSPPAPPGIEDTSSVLLQDMRKLAREAFPVPQEQEGSANIKTDGRNGRITRQEPEEFTFPSQAYDLDVRSDYHSTREELDSSAQSDELRRNCYFERLQLEDPTATANGCNAAARRRNSSSSSDALGGHGDNQQQRERDEMAIVAVTNPEPDPARKKKIYPPLKSPYVVCQYCHKLLEVPGDLPPSRSGIQKLRCGACQNVSKFTLVNHGQTRLDIVPVANSCDSTDTSRNNSNGDVIDHKRKMNVGMSMASSVSSRCGSPGSAPASFHPRHPGDHHRQRMSSNSNNKGYDSAPELQHDASASTSSGHARTISAGSSSTVPLAPCLHELFGYDTPSQFFKVGDKKSTGSSSSSEPPSQKPRAQGLKGLLFKSIHDISKLHFQQPHYTGVTINGRVVPEELVKKAEEQAGPIHPGSYWYDYRAGFWGVMGGPCVGIVPPCIDAFKFPAMPVNCAGGKTKVLVNGRELHQQDLQVLVKRGLPATPNVAYTIDVEGVVVEDATKNEVTCLGKLAPSIEKRGVGFGMFPLLT